MVVYFIRHGETDFNKRCLIQGMSDIPLNDKGIHQAELAADWFKQQGIVFDEVFSSPLVRARKTAAIVSGRTFEEVHPDARIQEMDFGVDEGKPYSMIRDLFDGAGSLCSAGKSREYSDASRTCPEVFGHAVGSFKTK